MERCPYKKVCAFIVLAFLIIACGQRPIKKKKTQFKTTDASVLFFKNIRGLYYNFEERKDAKSMVYTPKNFVVNTERHVLFPKIVHAYMLDKAFLFLEPQPYDSSLVNTAKIHLKIKSKQKDTIFELSLENVITQYETAKLIHEAIQKEYDMYLVSKSSNEIPFMVDKDLRAAFSMTVKDFNLLTNQIDLQISII